jgi:hypothetical protein
MMADFYGTDNISFTIGSDEFNGVTKDQNGVVRPVVTRHFTNFSQAAEENGQSRIYLGIHWSFDKVQGIRQGGRVADYIFSHFLQPADRGEDDRGPADAPTSTLPGVPAPPGVAHQAEVRQDSPLTVRAPVGQDNPVADPTLDHLPWPAPGGGGDLGLEGEREATFALAQTHAGPAAAPPDTGHRPAEVPQDSPVPGPAPAGLVSKDQARPLRPTAGGNPAHDLDEVFQSPDLLRVF